MGPGKKGDQLLWEVAAWLNKPFPKPGNLKTKLIIPFFVAFLVACILMIFQPFGIGKISEGKLLFIGGYAFIIFLVMTVTSMVLPLIFPNFFNPDKWNIGRYLYHIIIDYLTISLFAWIYTVSVASDIIEANTFAGFLSVTLAVSVFPVLIVVYGYEKTLLTRNLKNAEFLTKSLEKLSGIQDMGLIRQLVFREKSRVITLSSEDFICARAKGNYSQIYYLESKEMKKALIRITLSGISEMADGDPSIIRCHKSAIVNLNYVLRVGGNARNYYLEIKEADLRIHLSRTVQNSILEQFHLK
jgi:hypothetical protein